MADGGIHLLWVLPRVFQQVLPTLPGAVLGAHLGDKCTPGVTGSEPQSPQCRRLGMVGGRVGTRGSVRGLSACPPGQGAGEHCYYQGRLRGQPRSFAALSSCHGLQ